MILTLRFECLRSTDQNSAEKMLSDDFAFDVFRESQTMFNRVFLVLYGFMTVPMAGIFALLFNILEYFYARYRLMRKCSPVRRHPAFALKGARALLATAQLLFILIVLVWVCTIPTGIIPIMFYSKQSLPTFAGCQVLPAGRTGDAGSVYYKSSFLDVN